MTLAGSPASASTRVQSWAIGHTTHLPAAAAEYHDQTIRENVRLSVAGGRVQVRISNHFGTAPLVIGAAHVAVAGSGSTTAAGTDRVLTFGGRSTVTIPPDAPALSDPVDLAVAPESDLAVSLDLPEGTKGETTTFFQGNSFVAVGNVAATAEWPEAKPLAEWPFLSGISVGREGRAVVAITDSASLTSAWPRALAAWLAAEGGGDIGVVSTAVAGNRLLYNAAGPDGPRPQWGESVLTRFDRDVLGQAGVRVEAAGVKFEIEPYSRFEGRSASRPRCSSRDLTNLSAPQG